MFTGSYVALITPFCADGNSIDEHALLDLVDWHITSGTDGLVPVGTSGESPTLSAEEHQRVIQLVVKQVAGRIPVIAGAGSNNTREALDFNQHAAATGASASLHVTGYYNKPSQEGFYQHYKKLALDSVLPIIIYDIPPRTSVGLELETLARLADYEHIVGIKDATSDLSRPVRQKLKIHKDFSYLSGDDATAVAYNASGGNGCISVTANVAPALCSAMQAACRDGDFPRAMIYQQKLMPLHQALFAEPSPAGVKYAMSLLGKSNDVCRLPMVPLNYNTKIRIERAMEKLELI